MKLAISPKITEVKTKDGKKVRGISEAEFSRWLKKLVKVYSFNSKHEDAFFATGERITRPEAMKIEGLVIPIAKESK